MLEISAIELQQSNFRNRLQLLEKSITQPRNEKKENILVAIHYLLQPPTIEIQSIYNKLLGQKKDSLMEYLCILGGYILAYGKNLNKYIKYYLELLP